MELVLNTYGVSLNRDNEAFVISSKDGKRRIPVTGLKTIHIGKGAQITSDVSRACFISIDADAYYNPTARCVNMYDYASPDNPQALFEIKRETEKEEKTNTPQIKSTADDEAIKKIKALLNPKNTKPEKTEPHIPEQLNEIMDELQTYLNNTGVILYEVKNIQYGKKLRLKVGSRLGEINLFYSKHGFSVVRSPRTGTSAEVNELMSALIEEFLISLI